MNLTKRLNLSSFLFILVVRGIVRVGKPLTRKQWNYGNQWYIEDITRFSFYYIGVIVSKIKKWTKNKGMTSTISSLVEIWKISHSYPGCSFVWKIRVVCFSVRHSYLCNNKDFFSKIHNYNSYWLLVFGNQSNTLGARGVLLVFKLSLFRCCFCFTIKHERSLFSLNSSVFPVVLPS